ncbi:hypothetical protein BTO04_03105 [Polaribacter sp. SA4-10]|uniref:hypothetical protein n=1 Tax=Polaribacter sp. SA4-10 TaxID=754397 RepID=UPI000B3C05F4|nr:hypothetical protein [Polaribacter sp. SA4-10]ARV05748.1 hypothetical protein BTO04_03105 [Polaribacter sp. SA4-10]
MAKSIKKLHKILVILPFVGLFLFVCFYIIASLQYTGGSFVAPDHLNFSLKNNYLCDLLETYQIDGTLNQARLFARIALVVICFSILLFWTLFIKLFPRKSKLQVLMQIMGILSMLVLLFLVSGNHDIIIRIAGFFGTIAHLIALYELYKIGYFKLTLFGVFSFLLFLMNYFLYELALLLYLLPIIQKITFILFLSWFTILNSIIYRHLNTI